METSIAMGRIAAEDGIEMIVATPHVIEGLYEGADLDERVTLLQAEFDAMSIPVKVARGAEVPMSICMSGDGDRLKALSIGGRYLLMESAETTFDQVNRAVYQVRLAGLYPVLAHPERTVYAQGKLDELADLVEREEVYCQVTVASMSGVFGSKIRKTSVRMARRGLVHLLATDAHSVGKRAPVLTDSFKELASIAGDDSAKIAVRDNPLLMLDGQRMLTPGRSGGRSKSRSFWRRQRNG